jgi:hypothetical protein
VPLTLLAIAAIIAADALVFFLFFLLYFCKLNFQPLMFSAKGLEFFPFRARQGLFAETLQVI